MGTPRRAWTLSSDDGWRERESVILQLGSEPLHWSSELSQVFLFHVTLWNRYRVRGMAKDGLLWCMLWLDWENVGRLSLSQPGPCWWLCSRFSRPHFKWEIQCLLLSLVLSKLKPSKLFWGRDSKRGIINRNLLIWNFISSAPSHHPAQFHNVSH